MDGTFPNNYLNELDTYYIHLPATPYKFNLNRFIFERIVIKKIIKKSYLLYWRFNIIIIKKIIFLISNKLDSLNYQNNLYLT